MYVHIKNGLAQVKDKNNLSIFYVKSGEKIRTTVNLAGGNLPIDPILRKSSLKGKNVPNFNGGAKCFDNILNKRNIYMNPPQKLQKHYLSKDFS